MACLLYNQSAYNLLESALTPQKLVALAKTHGYSAVGICDNQVLFGVAEFFWAAKKQGIKPIIGMQIKVPWQQSSLNLAVYAKNDIGYQQLMYLSSSINCDEEISFTQLLNENLVFCLLATSEFIYEDLLEENIEVLQEKLTGLSEHLTYYLAIKGGESALNGQLDNTLRKLVQLTKIPCLALPLIRREKPEDEKLLRVLMAIKLQCELKDKNLIITEDNPFLSPEELKKYFREEEIANTDYLASLCNVEMDFPKATLPSYNNKDGTDSKTFISKLCNFGLAKRLNNSIPFSYKKRLDDELAIITKMHYEDYFLLVYDFILYAKKHNIPVGPGRGSAAGSLVAYCLGITQVDPMKYQLLFERFLNPERISMPDIDTDIADVGRDQVVAYLMGKYADYRGAHILTFGTFKAKQALRDVAKVYGLPLATIDMIAKTIPFIMNGSLAQVYQNTPAFRVLLENGTLPKEIYEVATQIEFLPRHLSTHAAGIVLADQKIYNFVPLTKVNGLLSTQFTMNYLEDFGLIKMDLLGLRNLTIIDDIVKVAKLDDPNSWPLDKPEVYQLLSRADTLGVFQLESSGMKNTLRKLQPRCFDDIIALVALYRPGPMQFIDQFIYNRQNPNTVDYGHPDLKPILQNTSGIMVFQEQIMEVVQKIAGFSLAKADVLRKAISKKNAQELQSLQTDFISGCLKQGYDRQIADKIFAMIEKFANYGFNKAHSVGYAMIAYQCAYLKTFYPLAFYQSLLNSVISIESKLREYIGEVRTAGIAVLPPSVNFSYGEFSIEGKALRFPLSSIKGLGSVAVNSILTIRKENDGFVDFADLVLKLAGLNSASKIIENLIKVGACDEFAINRQSLLASLPRFLQFSELGLNRAGQQVLDLNTMGTDKPQIVRQAEDTKANLQYEQEILGFYFSLHPCAIVRQQFSDVGGLSQLNKQSNQRVAAMITRIKPHRAKNGAEMAFLRLEDESGKYEAVVLPDVFEQIKEQLVIDNVAIFDLRQDELSRLTVRGMRRV